MKNQFRSQGRVATGKHFELFLRLLHNTNGTGRPKHTPGEFDEDREFQAKKWAKRMEPPNIEDIRERTHKKGPTKKGTSPT